MRFTTARFLQFRNIALCDLDLNHNRHFMLGTNGQGKSNCLEALGFVFMLRSFRTQTTKALFQKDCAEFRLYYEIEHEKMRSTQVELEFKGHEKILLIDGNRVQKMADFIGLFPVVPLHAGDLMILKGAPLERRRFFDMTFASIDAEYFQALRLYHRSLQERNRLLKMEANASAFSAFEKELALHADSLIRKRQAGIEKLGKILSEVYAAFAKDSEAPSLSYKVDVNLESVEAYEQLFSDNRKRDSLIGSTQKGPHRDDYNLNLAIGGAKEYGSDGQQRALCVALRVAQAQLFEAVLGIKPVLLVDDVLGELDPIRRQGFWDTCPRDSQIIASGTEFLTHEQAGDWAVWNVSQGAFSRNT